MKWSRLLPVLCVLGAPAMATNIFNYDWEDGGTALRVERGAVALTNVSSPVHLGAHSLQLVDQGEPGTPDVWLAVVRNLQWNDHVYAGIYALKNSNGGQGIKLWARYVWPDGSDCGDAWGDPYVSGSSWGLLEDTWAFTPPHSECNGLAITARTLSEAGDGGWIDDLHIEAPDHSAILWPVPDCNTNGIADDDDIAAGMSPDWNTNGTPDECENPCDPTPSGIAHVRLLDGGSLNGTAVNGQQQEIAVGLGASIHGSLVVEALNPMPPTSIAPLGWTVDWGNRESNPQLTNAWIPPGVSTHTIDIDVVAPASPGTYHIVVAYRGEHNLAQVLSGTSWTNPQVVWFDGNDLGFDWDEADYGTALHFGEVCYATLSPLGFDTQWRPGTAVVVRVLEHDCNSNGIEDAHDLFRGTSLDCNANLIPDECDVAAGAEWTLRATSGPPAAGQHALVYDAARQIVLTVGGIGRVGGDTFHPGTWAWDGMTWEQIATGGPSPRFSYAIAYDEHRKVVVLHGGLDSGFHLLGDTWEWNGATWNQVATSGPSPREGARMCYDRARRKMILFGGRTAGQFPAETWSWDGQTWVVESTTGPAGRRYYGLCYDSGRDVVVMVGGQSQPPGYIYGDTWEWNGEVWQQVATTGPEATDGIHLAYDEARGVSVMFRGHDDTLPNYIHAETWEWDGVSWVSRTLPMPSPRAHYGMAYDSDRHVVVLFGGGDAVAEGRLSDTWEYGDIDCDGDLVPDSCETDSDSDGIVDNCDNCAATGNPRQEDFDHDGQGDSCDPDMDNDGVVNEYDACNYTPPGAVVIMDPESCLRGTLRFDADGDCDVDLMDFAEFERELSPPN